MKRKKWVFGLMVIIFIAPMVASNWLYRHAGDLHLPTKNRGILINPPEYQTALHLLDHQQQLLAESYFQGTWWIMVLNEGTCDEACREQLHWLSRSFIALSKEKHRVRALVAIAPSTDLSFQAWLRENHPNVELAYLKGLPAFLNKQPGLILMDPLGNIMLRYTMEEDFNHCFKDLKWLLHNSQIG